MQVILWHYLRLLVLHKLHKMTCFVHTMQDDWFCAYWTRWLVSCTLCMMTSFMHTTWDGMFHAHYTWWLVLHTYVRWLVLHTWSLVSHTLHEMTCCLSLLHHYPLPPPVAPPPPSLPNFSEFSQFISRGLWFISHTTRDDLFRALCKMTTSVRETSHRGDSSFRHDISIRELDCWLLSTLQLKFRFQQNNRIFCCCGLSAFIADLQNSFFFLKRYVSAQNYRKCNKFLWVSEWSGSNICKQIHVERKWQHAAVDKRMRWGITDGHFEKKCQCLDLRPGKRSVSRRKWPFIVLYDWGINALWILEDICSRTWAIRSPFVRKYSDLRVYILPSMPFTIW